MIAHPVPEVRQQAEETIGALRAARGKTWFYAQQMTEHRGGPEDRTEAEQAAGTATTAANRFREALLDHRDDTG